MYSSVAPPDQKQGEEIPAGVSESNWKKFQELKERRQKICKKVPEQRRKRAKRKTVESELLSEIKETAISRVGEQLDKKIKKPQGVTLIKKKTENEEKWKELRQYFPKSSGLHATSSCYDSYEKEIDKAIEKGDLKEAESLSDKLVIKDFVNKAAIAIKSRDFDEKLKAEEQIKTEKRKKQKLHWGFEQKERWESKGNM